MAQELYAWKFKCKSLEYIDLFSKSPDIYFKGKPQKSSLIGRIFTISYFAIYFFFFIYKIIRMSLKKEISFYETQTWTGEIPSLNLTNDYFYGGFALVNVSSGDLFIDETIYYPVVTFVTKIIDENGEEHTDYEDLEVERCQLEKFGSKFRHLFIKEIDNLYCVKRINVTIQGHTTLSRYSYFYIQFFPCVNGVNGKKNCQPQDIVRAFLGYTLLTVKMQDIELSPQSYKNPISERTRILSAPISETLYNNIQAYFHIINMETDNDILGFEALSKHDKKKFFKYDVTFMVTNMLSTPSTVSGDAICNIQIQLTEQMITIDRTYPKLLEVLGDVGGLMEFVFSFFKLLSIFITKALYEKCLVNNLFIFDLDKKIIELKDTHKIKTIIYNKEMQNIKVFLPLQNKSSRSHYDNEESFKTKDLIKEASPKQMKINKEPISNIHIIPNINSNKKTSKKKRKTNRTTTTGISSDYGKISNVDIESKNKLRSKEELEVTKVLNNKLDSDSKNPEGGEKKIKNIDKIKFSKVDLYLCFFFTRKRKNLQNVLIDEGMRMVSQNLDILNIFMNQIKMDNYMEQFNNYTNQIRFSEKCKKLIEDLYYSHYLGK